MRCVECGEEDDFEYGDGTGYCRVCGTQSQDIREEVVDFNETLFSTANKSIRRVAKGLDSSRAQLQPDRMWTIPEAVQIILQLHVNSLIAKLSLASSFKNLVGNLWIRFLAKIGLTSVAGIEPVPLTEPYKVTIFDNFSLLFLALLLSNYPVLLSDLINWINDGTLCFLDAAKLLPGHFKPRQLVNTSLGVKTIPSILSLSERLGIIMDILDDVQKPSFNLSSLDKIISRLLKYYEVSASDVHLLCLGLFERFYFTKDLIFPSDLSVASTFVTCLRLYFQFEIEESEKGAWLAWFEPYLQHRHQSKVALSMCTSFLSANVSTTAQHFLNSTQTEYLGRVSTVTRNHAKVLKTETAVRELQLMFIPSLIKDEKFQPYWEGNTHDKFRTKNDVKRGKKRRIGNEERKTPLRKIIIYPVDELIRDTILPLELDILIKDIAAHFHCDASNLFSELQKIAKLCE